MKKVEKTWEKEEEKRLTCKDDEKEYKESKSWNLENVLIKMMELMTWRQVKKSFVLIGWMEWML